MKKKLMTFIDCDLRTQVPARLVAPFSSSWEVCPSPVCGSRTWRSSRRLPKFIYSFIFDCIFNFDLDARQWHFITIIQLNIAHGYSIVL